jgi:hypothetical protein
MAMTNTKNVARAAVVVTMVFGLCSSAALAPRSPDDIVSVPEPATLSLLAVGGLAMIRRRK